MAAKFTPTPQQLPITEGRHWQLEAEGMTLTSRSARGEWQAIRNLPFSEMRLIYRYGARDYNTLGWAALAWLVLVFLTALALGAASMDVAVILAVAVVEFLVVMGVAAYRVFSSLRPMLRVETYGGELIVPAANPEFFPALAAALNAYRTSHPAPVEIDAPVVPIAPPVEIAWSDAPIVPAFEAPPPAPTGFESPPASVEEAVEPYSAPKSDVGGSEFPPPPSSNATG